MTLSESRPQNRYRNDFWTEDRHLRMLELVDSGERPEAIARDLGCTRNAVIGRLYRTYGGWMKRIGTKSDEPIETLEERLRFDIVTQRGCVWVEGDPRGKWTWCGAPLIAPGQPYCEAHQKKAWHR